jgi:hypothetical protein
VFFDNKTYIYERSCLESKIFLVKYTVMTATFTLMVAILSADEEQMMSLTCVIIRMNLSLCKASYNSL